jgi:hypothetical protein
MTVEQWLKDACADADRRGLPELKPLLESLVAPTVTLRTADWNDVAMSGRVQALTSHTTPEPSPERRVS